jgi:hypothetical protein
MTPDKVLTIYRENRIEILKQNVKNAIFQTFDLSGLVLVSTGSWWFLFLCFEIPPGVSVLVPYDIFTFLADELYPCRRVFFVYTH